MLEMALTPKQRMGLCYLISETCTVHGRDWVLPVDGNDDLYTQHFDEVYLRINDNIVVRISDAQLISIVQQLLDNSSNDVVEITAVLLELDATDPEDTP